MKTQNDVSIYERFFKVSRTKGSILRDCLIMTVMKNTKQWLLFSNIVFKQSHGLAKFK